MGINMKRRIFGLSLVTAATAVLVACGGGGTNWPAASTVALSVTPAKGAIYGATATAYGLTSSTALVAGTTDSTTGKASLAIPTTNASGVVMITVAGNSTATYYNEANNTKPSFASTNVFATVLPSVAAGASAGVTPLTTMAVKLAGVDVTKIGTAGYTPPTLTSSDIIFKVFD